MKIAVTGVSYVDLSNVILLSNHKELITLYVVQTVID